MATIQKFEDLECWKKARVLTNEIYRLSSQGKFARDFGLRDQMRRAAVSIMSNIAEGFERDGTKEFLQFLATAKGSAGEVRSQLYIALDVGYLELGDHHKLLELSREVSRMIAGFMKYLRSTEVRGAKYRDD
jgi:four helix bundle protein